MEIIRYEYKSRSRKKKNESRLLWIKKEKKNVACKGFLFRRWRDQRLRRVTWNSNDLLFNSSPRHWARRSPVLRVSARELPIAITRSGWPDPAGSLSLIMWPLPLTLRAAHLPRQHPIWGQERDDGDDPRDHLAAKRPSPSRPLTRPWPTSCPQVIIHARLGAMALWNNGVGGGVPSRRPFAKERPSSFLLVSSLRSRVDSLVCLCVCGWSIDVPISFHSPPSPFTLLFFPLF